MFIIEEVVSMVETTINKYKQSDDYVKRCFLGIDDIINLKEDECLKQGILSISYLNDDTVIELHITTDFIRNVSGSTYDFSILFNLSYDYEYLLIIDELGDYWEKDRNEDGKVIIYNLLYALSGFPQIKFNCKFDNCVLYETVLESPEFINDEVLNKQDIRDLDIYFKILKENIFFISNCDIYFNGYNRFKCTSFPLFLEYEKNNIKCHFEKSILFIHNKMESLELLNQLESYLDESTNPLAIDYINIQCSNIDNKSVNYIKNVLDLLYNILSLNSDSLSLKLDTYITMSYYIGSSYIKVGQFYKRIRKCSRKYEDVLKFDTLDSFIDKL